MQEEVQERSLMEVMELCNKRMFFNVPEGPPPVREQENTAPGPSIQKEMQENYQINARCSIHQRGFHPVRNQEKGARPQGLVFKKKCKRRADGGHRIIR